MAITIHNNKELSDPLPLHHHNESCTTQSQSKSKGLSGQISLQWPGQKEKENHESPPCHAHDSIYFYSATSSSFQSHEMLSKERARCLQ